MVVLCDNDRVIIETLSVASDKKRKQQSFVGNLLSIIFETPDISKDQDHFKDTIFVKTPLEGILFMYPDLN